MNGHFIYTLSDFFSVFFLNAGFHTSYYQVCVGENIFGLHQSSCVPRVEKIKDPVSVDSHRTISYKIRNIKTCLQCDFTKTHLICFIIHRCLLKWHFEADANIWSANKDLNTFMLLIFFFYRKKRDWFLEKKFTIIPLSQISSNKAILYWYNRPLQLMLADTNILQLVILPLVF